MSKITNKRVLIYGREKIEIPLSLQCPDIFINIHKSLVSRNKEHTLLKGQPNACYYKSGIHVNVSSGDNAQPLS